MRVIVTGSGGLLGGRIAALLHADGFEVLAAYRETPPPRGPRAVSVELSDPDALARLLDASRPEAIVHAAVLGRVDQCQDGPALAEATNAGLPGRIARICRERGLRLVALSTDMVFAGDRAPLREDDPTGPLSVYGRTKREGERAVLEALPGAAVARVALVYGRGHGPRGTSSESVAWALAAGRAPRLFTDEFRTPIDAVSVADAIGRLLRRGGSGLYHLGGPERLSRHELGARTARVLGLDASRIVAVRQDEVPAPEPRPKDVSLDSGRARRELGWEPRPVDEALRDGRTAPE
ncbi:MAG: SDR family oxidoreductase [Vicinamibacteria bacterium]